jgi:hypothetical protein
MTHASYNIRRVFWMIWQWEAVRGGSEIGHGRAFGKSGAKWAARCAIRATRAPLAERLDAAPVRREAEIGPTTRRTPPGTAAKRPPLTAR